MVAAGQVGHVTIEAGAADAAAASICVFLHGRGQDPGLMVEHVVARMTGAPMRFLLPAAPSNQWYAARAIDPLTEPTLRQLEEALDIVDATLDRAFAEARGRPVHLAGFSQGACLALEHLMRRRSGVASVAALTGCRVGAAGDDLPARPLGSIPVLMTNSDADAWVPLQPFVRAVETVAANGAALSVEIVPGRDHAVAASEIEAFRRHLSARGTA
jgi:phospholipase/carboxylesterase